MSQRSSVCSDSKRAFFAFLRSVQEGCIGPKKEGLRENLPNNPLTNCIILMFDLAANETVKFCQIQFAASLFLVPLHVSHSHRSLEEELKFIQ